MQRLQCDDIWRLVGVKKMNVTPPQELDGWGDIWTSTSIDADASSEEARPYKKLIWDITEDRRVLPGFSVDS
ncbi:MAG TPA: hypothetical protein VF392_09890 [Terracidiphilus sp.]